MFAALRRAWQRYVASLPAPPEEEHVSDTDAMNEFRPPPVDRNVVAAFTALATCVLSHMPEGEREAQTRKLRSRLNRKTSPAEALGAWIQANSGPKSKVGVIAVDWKAREEVLWQARRLCAAHGVSTGWAYDHGTDEEWKSWQERKEVPVDSPLRGFAIALQPTRIVLLRFSVDDTVCAFAVGRDRGDEVCRGSI
ncbi:hypothetical protein [Rhizobacter sp. Root1221]|uniref:hypothetical protein n=1 Tax=Rhizobacter sp. Root1221 TaxID=1736433 RepID=UPI0006FFDA22|nr:hypothetical protein [Rhizobacter sp. Root1221]KQW00444.1 hypothetical protein ASC87_18000 [Rhizobacter sp. Root1221]